MRLIILTQYYPPETGAPQRRLSDLAQRFVQLGHTVTVLTAMPNYPTGRVFSGYGRVLRRETIKDVNVIRTFVIPTQSTSFALRLLCYLSFVFSSILFGLAFLHTADFLLIESPPLFLGVSAFILSRVKRARMIFNVSDIWPSGLARLDLVSNTSSSYRLASRLEAFCYKSAALVTCQTRGIMAEINARFPDVKTYYLTNGIAVEDFGPSRATTEARLAMTKELNELVLLYAGLLGVAQSLEQIVDAAALLVDEPFRFVFLGDGPQKAMLQGYAKRLNLHNVSFLAPVPLDDVPAYLAAADIIVVSLMATYKEAVPSKLFEAMASQKPVLLVAASEACDIVQRYDAGVIAPPGNPQEIAQQMQNLARDPTLREKYANNARASAERDFNREQIARDLAAFLETL